MTQRDIALELFKTSNKNEDLRHYKNLKNSVNNEISKERYNRKVKSFQLEDSST